MRFSPPAEVFQLYTHGFEGDFLQRAKVGQGLSDLMTRIEDPLVVVLDGQWGSGKTHFLQRWVGAHNVQFGGNATTIYFDAFTHDYLEDPLTSLVSAISDRMPRELQGRVQQLRSLAWRLLGPAARIGLSALSFGASEAVNELGDAIVSAATDETKSAIDAFWKREEGRRDAMRAFEAAISAMISEAGDGAGNRLIIVIDELDRCRPDYALQVLEVIKHFFSVNGLHFVLGVNLTSLENSVRSRYGAGIDATAYLQKFISIKFALPNRLDDNDKTPVTLKYAAEVGRRMGVSERLSRALLDHLKTVERTNRVTIRDVGRILGKIALLPDEINTKNYMAGWIEVLMTLLVVEEIQPLAFPAFQKGIVSEDVIDQYFGADANNIDRGSDLYDHEVAWRRACWRFVCRLTLNEGDAGISRSFNEFSFRSDPSLIPETVFRDWMNPFRIV